MVKKKFAFAEVAVFWPSIQSKYCLQFICFTYKNLLIYYVRLSFTIYHSFLNTRLYIMENPGFVS